MAAVQVEESQIRGSADFRKRNPQLRSIKGGQSESANTGRTYPRLRQAARTGATRAGRSVRASSIRGATAQYRRATGGIGTVFVLLTGAGVAFAILRNPRILTVPIRFVGTVVQKFGAVFGGSAAPVPGSKGTVTT